MIKIIPSKTVTILPSCIGKGGKKLRERIDQMLRKSLLNCCFMGYDTFICPLITEFDIMAAKNVLFMRNSCPQIKLIIVRTVGCDIIKSHPEITEKATEIVDFKLTCGKTCYDYMIENSTHILCYHGIVISGNGHDKRILTTASHGYSISNIASLIHNINETYENKLKNICLDK